MLLLNGPAAELMWALAECVTNPELVATLMAHVRTSSGEYAETFQAIIKATFRSNVPVKIEYVAYRVLSSP
jgi:hypothetical protein